MIEVCYRSFSSVQGDNIVSQYVLLHHVQYTLVPLMMQASVEHIDPCCCIGVHPICHVAPSCFYSRYDLHAWIMNVDTRILAPERNVILPYAARIIVKASQLGYLQFKIAVTTIWRDEGVAHTCRYCKQQHIAVNEPEGEVTFVAYDSQQQRPSPGKYREGPRFPGPHIPG